MNALRNEAPTIKRMRMIVARVLVVQDFPRNFHDATSLRGPLFGARTNINREPSWTRIANPISRGTDQFVEQTSCHTRTHPPQGSGIRTSFEGIGKCFPMDIRSKGRSDPKTAPGPAMSFRLAIPWPGCSPAEPTSISPTALPVQSEDFGSRGVFSQPHTVS